MAHCYLLLKSQAQSLASLEAGFNRESITSKVMAASGARGFRR
jgi:hypothetical protein